MKSQERLKWWKIPLSVNPFQDWQGYLNVTDLHLADSFVSHLWWTSALRQWFRPSTLTYIKRHPFPTADIDIITICFLRKETSKGYCTLFSEGRSDDFSNRNIIWKEITKNFPFTIWKWHFPERNYRTYVTRGPITTTVAYYQCFHWHMLL